MLEVGLAGQEAPEGVAPEGGAVVGDDAQALNLAGLEVDAVAEQRVAEQRLGARDRALQGIDGVACLGGRRDVRRAHELGCVVDDEADPPGASPGGLELGDDEEMANAHMYEDVGDFQSVYDEMWREIKSA